MGSMNLRIWIMRWSLFTGSNPTLSAARSGSFAITTKLSVAKGEQIHLPFIISPEQVIDEAMEGIELVNKGDEKGLRERIQQDNYYRNFVALTRDMAPDGDKIRFVGFTSSRGEISLTRQRSKIEISPEVGKGKAEPTPLRLVGVLDYATARRKKDAIGLTGEDGQEYIITVQEGLDD